MTENKTWTDEERKLMEKRFEDCFKAHKTPGKMQYRELIAEYPKLFIDQKWENLEDSVRNHTKNDDIEEVEDTQCLSLPSIF